MNKRGTCVGMTESCDFTVLPVNNLAVNNDYTHYLKSDSAKKPNLKKNILNLISHLTLSSKDMLTTLVQVSL